MSKIYLPTSEQMDTTLRNLERIAGHLGKRVDTTTWAGVQRAVRAGDAPKLFPVGTQFNVSHSVYGNIVFDVVAHDHHKSVSDEHAHTMTLMAHDAVDQLQFANAQAFWAGQQLNPGTYNFTLQENYSSWAAGTYQFTLTNTLPAGGQLTISGYPNVPLTERKVQAYASRTTRNMLESTGITIGNGGTSLGKFGDILNHIHCVAYGSNGYQTSAIRQFLNSTETAGNVWSDQGLFDRPPTWVSTKDGFAHGIDEEFLSIVGKVIVPCAHNNIHSDVFPGGALAGEKYSVYDKFYLASQKEIFGTDLETVSDDSSQLHYYKDSTGTDRIKYVDGTAAQWWTRSAYSSTANHVMITTSEGSRSTYYAVNDNGCVPVCTIV